MANNRLFTCQAIYLVAFGVSMNTSILQEPGNLGAFYEKDNKLYQLVQLLGTGSAVLAGEALCWAEISGQLQSGKASFIVTHSVASTFNMPAGVAVASLTPGNYGLIQVKGPFTSVYAASVGDITKGALIQVHNTINGAVQIVSNPAS